MNSLYSQKMFFALTEKAWTSVKNWSEFDIQESFAAVDIGLGLGWSLMRIADTREREWQTHFLERNLDAFNTSPFCNNEIWERVKNLGIILPINRNAGFTGKVLREHTGTTVKEVMLLVTKDPESVAFLDKIPSSQKETTVEQIYRKYRDNFRSVAENMTMWISEVGQNHNSPEEMVGLLLEKEEKARLTKERE